VSVVNSMSSGAAGQPPLALHARRTISGKQHQARRTLSRSGEKASEQNMMTTREKEIKKKATKLVGQRR